jgi:hypothetical protein
VSSVQMGVGTASTTAVDSREYRFSFHGIPFRFCSSSASLWASIAAWIRAVDCGDAKGDVSLTVHFEQVRSREAVPLSLSAGARRVFSGTMPALGNSLRALWQCDLHRDGERLVIDVRNHGVLVIDATRGAASGYFYRPETMAPDRLETFFHYTMIELLKGRNIFPLPAAGLEYQGKGVLLHGRNGCGKTTAMLSLLRSGYRYLGDDHQLLHDHGATQRLLGTSLSIDVTDPTIEMFPELRAAGLGLLRQGAYRKSFHTDDVYPGSRGRSCEPAMILFPQVANMSHSCLQPLAKSLALEALVQREAYRHDADTAAKEFQVLSQLVQRTACYRLHFGSDVLDLPRLITPLLERH